MEKGLPAENRAKYTSNRNFENYKKTFSLLPVIIDAIVVQNNITL